MPRWRIIVSPAVEVGEEVLRPAAERGHPAAGQPLGEARREGPAQVGPADLGAGDDVAGEHRLEAAADRLHFRQFRQALPPARLRSTRPAL